MTRAIIGGFIAAAILGGAATVAPPRAEASKPFTRVTKIECSGCHKSKDEKDMSEKDLNACGLASDKVLKNGGYKRPPTEAEKLKAATKLLKGFKCPD